MKKSALIIISILFMTAPCHAVLELGDSESVITAPTISSKCRVLLKNREELMAINQRLSALIERNLKLQHEKIDDLELKDKLIKNLRKLKNEFVLSQNRIRHLNGEIVLTGCPSPKFQ